MQPKPPARAQEQSLEGALRGSPVSIFCDGLDHRYLSFHNPPAGLKPQNLLGCCDEQIFGSEAALAIIEAKRGALLDGAARELSASLEIEGELRHFDILIKPRYGVRDQAEGTYLLALDSSTHERDKAKLRLMAREVNHRSKNLLAVIQAIARQTANHAEQIDDFVDSFLNRLQSLAHAHDLLVQETSHGVPLTDVVRSQIGHQADVAESHYRLEGENLRLSVDATQHIGLAIHELATNALKYGALSVPDGMVFISWKRNCDDDGAPVLDLDWRESGGPTVAPPSRTGFGHVVLNKIAARALDAEVSTDFDPEGLRWSLRLPWTHVLGAP